MPTFVKIETGIVNKTTFDRYVPEHKSYIRQLIEKGHKAKSGYWKELGGGMLIFEADSLQQAREIVAQDPLILHQCVSYELHEWCIVMQ